MPAFIDITGQKFNKLTAIKYLGNQNWLCKCDCGNDSITTAGRMKSGNTKSCGCIKRSVLGISTTKHGMAGTRTHRIWKSMRNRCNNSKSPRYKDYGGRGITICKRWDKFENFLVDMGECPDGMSIDRVNNNKGYSPSNCKWSTTSEQASNTRNTIKVKGKTLVQLAKETGISYSTLYDRYCRGDHLS